MIDTWIKSTDHSALTSLCFQYKNVLGIKLLSGYYYACIRDQTPPTISSPIEQITEKEGGAVLGSWFSQPTPQYVRGVNIDGLEWGTWDNWVVVDVSKTTVNDMADFGCKIIRIPFMWERIQPTLSGSLDTSYLNRLKTAVGLCIDRGMHVIIDCHNYAKYKGVNMFADGGPTQADWVNLWVRLVREFTFNGMVSIDLMNEPISLNASLYCNAQQAIITAVRGEGFKGYIHTTYAAGWNSSVQRFVSSQGYNFCSVIDPLNKTLIHLHQYIDTDNNSLGTVAYTNAYLSIVDATNYARTNGLKLFLGEFGIVNNNQFKSEIIKMINYLESNKDVWVGWMPWGGGPYNDSKVFKLSRMSNGTKNPQMVFLSDYLRLNISNE